MDFRAKIFKNNLNLFYQVRLVLIRVLKSWRPEIYKKYKSNGNLRIMSA